MSDGLSFENSLAIIGDEDIILGFKVFGFRIYPLKEFRQFKEILDEVVKNKTAVCLIQDDIYNSAQDQINSYRSSPLPIFILFSKTGETNLLDNIIKDIRIRATGAF